MLQTAALQLSVAPGRLLRYAPQWDADDGSVCFDARSGDYWVLDARSQACLQWVSRQVTPVGWADLAEHLDGLPADALIQALVHAGLLAAWKEGQAVQLGAPDELAEGA